MHTLALAMILVTNGLRDAQARLSAEMMLQAQIERRKAQTAELKRFVSDCPVKRLSESGN